MKFIDYLTEQHLNRKLNEAIKLKHGDLGTYCDKYGETVGLLVLGELSHGYIAVKGGMIGVYNPKSIKKFTINDLNACVYIDETGKVEGKYPVSVFKGDFDSFLSMLDGDDEEDKDEDEDY